MSATGDHDTEEYVKQCLRFKLRIPEQEGFSFGSADNLISHLLNNGDLDDTCKKWILRAHDSTIYEIWRDHKTRLGGFQSSDAEAPLLNMGEPSVPHPSSIHDSGYAPSPDDLRKESVVSKDCCYDGDPELQLTSVVARADV